MTTHPILTRAAGGLLAAATLLGGVGLAAPAAQAYQPTTKAFYSASAQDKADFNKKNPILYPKSAQLEDGTLVATFERSIGDPVGQTLPIYRSTDYGTTWEPLSEVRSPAALTKGTDREAEYARYTSAWTNPYLYVMPETVGGLAKGTLVLAAIVSGDDPYLKEHLAVDPNFNRTADDFDRKDVALALYSSTDGGKDWNFLNIVAEGGWQGSYGGPFATENATHQNDPVWEPFLMVYDGRLVCYYSDENDFDWSSYDEETGAIALAADNDTAKEDGGSGQILAHRTWNGDLADDWSAIVVDEAGNKFKGRYAGGGRPGMTTVAPTTDGKWMMTFEWWNGRDANIQYKIADDPLEFHKVGRQPITRLAGGLTTGGSPVLVRLPDGRILYNAAGSADIWVNESGRSDGAWTRFRTAVGAGYSRNMQYVPQTGRVVLLQATFGGFNVSYGEVDLGRSQGAYYRLVNKRTGDVLSVGGQANDGAKIVGEKPVDAGGAAGAGDGDGGASDARDAQLWHIVRHADGTATLLNKAGGRAMAIDGGTIAAGGRLLSWVDDGGADKQWTLEPADDGAYRLGIGNGLFVGAGEAGAQATIGAKASDGSDEWTLQRDPEQVKAAAAEPLAGVSTEAGTAPVLPGTVKVTVPGGLAEFGDDATAAAPVDAPIAWDTVDPSAYAKAGSFTAKGTAHVVAAGVDTTLPVQVEVAVTAADDGSQPGEQPGGGQDGNGSQNGGSGNDSGNKQDGERDSARSGGAALSATGSSVATVMALAGAALLLGVAGLVTVQRRRD